MMEIGFKRDEKERTRTKTKASCRKGSANGLLEHFEATRADSRDLGEKV